MKKVKTFKEVLEAADRLTVDEQETIIDILRKRMIVARRKELVKEIKKAQRDFQQGLCQPVIVEEIMKEIL